MTYFYLFLLIDIYTTNLPNSLKEIILIKKIFF